MTVPTLPVQLIKSLTRTLGAAAAVTTSPFTGTQQVQDWGGSWWEYEIEMAGQQGRNGRILSAFLASLRGPVGTFLLTDPSIYNATGVGTPLVNGANQSGNSLITDGWSATGLKNGDFFQLGTDVNTRLYQLTADVVPSGGAATLQVIPALRSSPADNAPLIIAAPQVLLRAKGPIPAAIGGADRYQISFSAREAI